MLSQNTKTDIQRAGEKAQEWREIVALQGTWFGFQHPHQQFTAAFKPSSGKPKPSQALHSHARAHTLTHTHKYISPFILFQIPMWFPLILFYSVFPILKYLYIFPFELSEMARILASRWNWFFPSDPGIAEIAESRWRGPPSSCPSHQPRPFPMCRARKLQGFGFCCSWDHLVNACCSYLLGALPAPTQVSRGYFCGLRGHLATVIERKPYITTRPASLIL